MNPSGPQAPQPGAGTGNKSDSTPVEMLINRPEEIVHAKALMERIEYITLATSDKSGSPWSTPVFFAYDKKYNFYWISSQNCIHSRNIKENADIALVIFDSTVPYGRGFGVYAKAKANEVEDPEEVKKALLLIYTRFHMPPPAVRAFTGAPTGTALRVYKAVPLGFWVNDLPEKGGEFKSLRAKITLW